MEYQVIIPAAGQGKRMGAGKNKLFLELDKEPIIVHTLKVFLNDPSCKKIAVAIKKEEEQLLKGFIHGLDQTGKIHFVLGGQERQHSVYNGLKSLEKDTPFIVLVHDGARPFIQEEVIKQLVKTAHAEGAAIAAVPVKDTIKRADKMRVEETIDRASLWQVQTPQAFQYHVIWEAHEHAKHESILGTDEASLVERTGHPVQIVQSDYDNIKLTTPEDLYFAEAIMKKRSRESS